MTLVSAGHIILTPTQRIGNATDKIRTRDLLRRKPMFYPWTTATPANKARSRLPLVTGVGLWLNWGCWSASHRASVDQSVRKIDHALKLVSGGAPEDMSASLGLAAPINKKKPSDKSCKNSGLRPGKANELRAEALSLLVAAALLAASQASPCTDVCFGTCAVSSDTSMLVAPLFEPFQQVNLDACRAVCAATCNCVDTCQGMCATQLTDCRNLPDAGYFQVFACNFEFAACGMICSTQCTLTTSAGVLDRVFKVLVPSE
ncbi:hypothetical protein EGW08_006743 [Elysia chlorotica]|uniref:Uncharacterized protein n=1 Tax=Elysia chlorotica TaxID=188477 RepID=A0A3S0ZS12_ELYCH|nr:hypothetical protein EGW08_006743 [Elysia chlorotica]